MRDHLGPSGALMGGAEPAIDQLCNQNVTFTQQDFCSVLFSISDD